MQVEGEGEKDSSLSPGMLRQSYLLEMNQELVANNMTSMLKSSEFTLSNTIFEYECGLSYPSTKVQNHYNDEAK